MNHQVRRYGRTVGHLNDDRRYPTTSGIASPCTRVFSKSMNDSARIEIVWIAPRKKSTFRKYAAEGILVARIRMPARQSRCQ